MSSELQEMDAYISYDDEGKQIARDTLYVDHIKTAFKIAWLNNHLKKSSLGQMKVIHGNCVCCIV